MLLLAESLRASDDFFLVRVTVERRSNHKTGQRVRPGPCPRHIRRYQLDIRTLFASRSFSQRADARGRMPVGETRPWRKLCGAYELIELCQSRITPLASEVELASPMGAWNGKVRAILTSDLPRDLLK